LYGFLRQNNNRHIYVVSYSFIYNNYLSAHGMDSWVFSLSDKHNSSLYNSGRFSFVSLIWTLVSNISFSHRSFSFSYAWVLVCTLIYGWFIRFWFSFFLSGRFSFTQVHKLFSFRSFSFNMDLCSRDTTTTFCTTCIFWAPAARAGFCVLHWCGFWFLHCVHFCFFCFCWVSAPACCTCVLLLLLLLAKRTS